MLFAALAEGKPLLQAVQRPVEDAGELRFQLLGQQHVLFVRRDALGERDEPDAPPDAHVGAMDAGQMVGCHDQFELGPELKFLAVLETGRDGVAAGHLLDQTFVQHGTLISLLDGDKAGPFQAGHVAAGGTGGAAAGAGDGLGLGVHAVIAEQLGQRLQECGFAVGAVAVEKEHALLPGGAGQAVAGHHLQVFGQSSVPAGDGIQKRPPCGRCGVRVIDDLRQTGDILFPVMGQQLAAGQIQDAVLHVQQAPVPVELLRQHGDAGQVLGLLEKGLLAPAGAAFLDVSALGGGVVGITDAKAGLVHLIQHLVCKALDGGQVVPLPAGAVPHQPALVGGVVAQAVGVPVTEAAGVAGVVHGVALDAGGRRAGRGLLPADTGVFGIEGPQGFVLIRKGRAAVCCLRGRGVHLLTVGHGTVQGSVAVGLGTPALVPLGAHEAGSTEHPVHAGLVGGEPEGQQVAEAQVSLAVAGVVGLPAAGIQGRKALPVFGAAGGVQDLLVGAVHGLPHHSRGGRAGGFGLGQILRMDGGAGLGALGNGLCFQHVAGHGEIPAAVVHFQPDAALAAGAGGFCAGEQDMHAGAAGAGLGVAVHPGNDLHRHIGEGPGGRIPAVVNVDAAQPISQKHPDTAQAIAGDRGLCRCQRAPGGGLVGHGVLAGGGVDGSFGSIETDPAARLFQGLRELFEHEHLRLKGHVAVIVGGGKAVRVGCRSGCAQHLVDVAHAQIFVYIGAGVLGVLFVGLHIDGAAAARELRQDLLQFAQAFEGQLDGLQKALEIRQAVLVQAVAGKGVAALVLALGHNKRHAQGQTAARAGHDLGLLDHGVVTAHRHAAGAGAGTGRGKFVIQCGKGACIVQFTHSSYSFSVMFIFL